MSNKVSKQTEGMLAIKNHGSNRCCIPSPFLTKTTTLRIHTFNHSLQFPPQQRWLSSSTKSSSTKSTSSSWTSKAKDFFQSSFHWKTIARWIRYSRIPIVILSVYGLGYQQGIADHVRHPEETQRALLQQVYASVGVTSTSSNDDSTSQRNVYTIRDGEEEGEEDIISSSIRKFSFTRSTKSSTSSTSTNWSLTSCQRIARIGRSIIQIARIHVKEQMQRLAIELRANVLPSDCTNEDVIALLLEHPEFSTWYKAHVHLQGPWTYYLLETPIPNAFVSEVLPKRIFVTISMLELVENDDELALILAHEVSHLLLGHVSQQNWFETVLRTIEVLLLSIDPTEGLVSIAIVGGLATIRTALQASFSREHEREADMLGMTLAAKACYDTKRAPQVFQRLHQREQQSNTTSTGKLWKAVSFASSHPSSEERYQDLIQQSETEHPQVYEACQKLQKHMIQNATGNMMTRPWW